jgi:protein-L-isoaspartate(D-aspartate) O-methyltransferase
VLRRQMVERLETAGAIRSVGVRRAFLAVPREHYVAEITARDGIEAVYREQAALVTATDAGGRAISSSSAPAIMAPMLESLDLRPGMRVLEVGAGTGYNAALLEQLVAPSGRVVSVELEPSFARQARRALRAAGSRCAVVVGDGRLGFERAAPFDRVVVTASTEEIPRAWCEQLVEDGLVEAPLRLAVNASLQAVVTFRREGRALRSVAVVPGVFMPLRDAGADRQVDRPPLLGAWIAAPAGGGAPRNLLSLSGNEAAMTPATARRCLATMLGPSRLAGVVRPARVEGLKMFLALCGDRRLLACLREGRFGYAVVAAGGSSVAAVTAAFNKTARIEHWGSDEAARRLEAHLERWRLLGSPRLSELRIAVDYGDRPGGSSWRLFRRPDSTIRIDWAAPQKAARRR